MIKASSLPRNIASHVVALAWFGIAISAFSAGSNPKTWRDQHRIIDLHQHITTKEEFYARAIRIMDRSGVGIAVNLTSYTTTHRPGEKSEFEQAKDMADRLHPGRFMHSMSLDYKGWDEPDFSEKAVKQIEEGHRIGAAGLKEYKRLGLYLRDKAGKLLRIDDPKLDPVWRRCGELDMPVSIHVADPRAFWLPYDAKNERWKELKDHRSWWFGDPAIYPPREELLAALDRVIARNPGTTFVCVHFANNAEDLEWVDKALDSRPNMRADLAARIPEIGRHDPEKVRRLFEKHQDRILFATDFQVHNTMILGSSGSGPAPTEDDAVLFFEKHWRWMETYDRQFDHMTPIQGDWKIDAIGLPPGVLRKIYFDNARALMVRSLPLPTLECARVNQDFELTGKLDNPTWEKAEPVVIDALLKTGQAKPSIATLARLLWSDKFLYIGYESPFTTLTVFDPPNLTSERSGLWDRDVVEAFIGSDPSNMRNYTEYEVAPTGEKLDLNLALPEKRLEWQSGFEAKVQVDQARSVWTCEMKIPLNKLATSKPKPGDRWRVNLYRHDIAHKSFLAWNPTATQSAHTPQRFGIMQFGQ